MPLKKLYLRLLLDLNKDGFVQRFGKEADGPNFQGLFFLHITG